MKYFCSLLIVLCSCTWMYAQCPGGVCYPTQQTETTGVYRWYRGYGWVYEAVTPTEVIEEVTDTTDEDEANPVVGPVEKKVDDNKKALPPAPDTSASKAKKVTPSVTAKKKDLPVPKVVEDAESSEATETTTEVEDTKSTPAPVPLVEENKSTSAPLPTETEDALQPFVMASTDEQTVMSPPVQLSQTNGERETNALHYLNKVRTEQGLPALSLRASATVDTRRHCHYMFTVKQLSSIPKTQECTGYWEGNAERMVKAWLKNSKCSAILLNKNAKEVSIGTEANYWTIRLFQ